MSTCLLDANVLIATVFADHEHHERASTWLAGVNRFATCPLVEGALARFSLRIGESGATTTALLRAVRANPRGEFWADTLSYSEIDLTSLRGHRQVTDTYLAMLAASRGSLLATLDEGLAIRHADWTFLIPR